MFGPRTSNKKSQVTLELTLTLVVIMILLAGMVRAFCWMTKCLVQRQRAYMADFRNGYDDTREFYRPPRIDLVPDVIN